ncbi:hypothetical protein FSP39_021034 [Pinctada imbricata]|uniref:Uncharacterized protein n=1 Tax=Pinctada imbricata TaxID=66713 RepID=A0AA88Y144_PINIB|nr:hypothetical protein FSP39_021034 [Pinctada imbricata]
MQNERTTNENQCQEHRDVKYVAKSNGDKQTLESFNDDYDNEDEDGSGESSRAPIDHGWAWMVVLGSFGVFAVVIGILKSFGVLLVELSRKYDAPASLLSSSQSLCSCLHMSVGLVSNALSVRFGHRKIVFLGGVLTAAGLISTAFVTSIEWFFVTYGLITGFGLGMCMSPSLVVFGMFFRRRLALANGLASSGSGLGSFVKLFLNEANPGKSDLNDSRRISTSLPCIDMTVTPVRERASTFSHQSKIHLLTTNRSAAKAMLYASIESLPYFSELSQERTGCHAEEQYVNDEVKSTRKLVNWDLLKNPKFHMIVWGLFCALYGHHSLFTIIPSLAVEFGFSDRQGTSCSVTKDATNTWTTSIKLSSAVSFLGVLTLSSEYIFRVINRILN